MTESQRKRGRLMAFKVVAIYALAGALWILFSDRILLQVVDGDVAELGRLQTYKGWFFIAVTASLLYLLVRHAISTEAKIQHALNASERSFRAVFDGVTDPIFLHDPDTGATIDVNASAVSMYGYDREQLRAMRVEELGAGGECYAQDRVLDQIHRARDGEVQVFEWQGRHRDGHVFWVEVQMRKALIDDRDLILAVVRSIDERKRMELALRRNEDNLKALNAELEQRVAERTMELEATNKELGAFSYSVSHDLKAPLRGIDGYSQILLEDYGNQIDAEGRQFVANIRRGVLQMHELIEDMLAYSRMERRAVKTSLVDLRALVETIVRVRGQCDPDVGVSIELDVPNMEIHADRDGLALVLRNLLENAIKFSRKKMAVNVCIGARREDGKLLIWVKDDGIGFDMKYHDRIFEIFQRLHRAEDYPGTGVGLALVSKATHRMGGRVWAESEPDKGATFFLELPQ